MGNIVVCLGLVLKHSIKHKTGGDTSNKTRKIQVINVKLDGDNTARSVLFFFLLAYKFENFEEKVSK